jgi:predicted nucleic acid-binding protein
VRIVIDTNVLVSAAWVSLRQGWPTQIVRALLDGRLSGFHDARILSERLRVFEYKHVRARVPPDAAMRLLHALAGIEQRVDDVPEYSGMLPDASDRPFVEVALVAGAVLVTGNRKHFPADTGIEVLTPAEAGQRLLVAPTD